MDMRLPNNVRVHLAVPVGVLILTNDDRMPMNQRPAHRVALTRPLSMVNPSRLLERDTQ